MSQKQQATSDDDNDNDNNDNTSPDDEPASSSSSSSSSSWDAVVADYESRVEPFTFLFVEELLEPLVAVEKNTETANQQQQQQLRMLDVGCGTGALSLYAQEQLGFRVTATDVSSAMVERTRQRVTTSTNTDKNDDNSNATVEAVTVNGEELPANWTNRFDVAVAAFSVIFFPNVPRGLSEMHRCLVSRGTIVVAAWGSAEETPAFSIFPDALGKVKMASELQKQSSKPKRIVGSKETLERLLQEAGFEHVSVRGPVQRTLSVASAEAYYERFARGSPHMVDRISAMTASQVEQLKQHVMELAQERGGKNDGSIELPASAYFAYGTKP